MSVSSPQNVSLETALHNATEAFVSANTVSQTLSEERKQVLPGGNTRTTVHFDPFPVAIESAEGPWLVDADGHRYADFVNEYSAGVFGHSHPVILKAVSDALSKGMGYGGPNVYEGRLGRQIVDRFPSIESLRFCNSGTEANLLALGTARAVSGRDKILVFEGAYHGSLLYFHNHSSPINVPMDVVMAPFNNLERTAELIRLHAGELAAVIIEPMQGGAGCIAGDPAFLSGLRSLCTELDIILVFDEVMTSRLSVGGRQAQLGIVPDMTTLGKYIGGGFTLAAFGGKKSIMSRFDPTTPNAFPHGGTFNNNVVAVTAGCRAFEELLTEQALNDMNGLGDSLRNRLNEFAKERNLPFQLTGLGSLIGLHFNRGDISSVDDLAQSAERAAKVSELQCLMHFDMLARGHYIARRGYATLSIVSTGEQVQTLCDDIQSFLTEREPILREIDGLS